MYDKIKFLVKKTIILMINSSVLCLSLLIPKTNKIVVVGGWFGERFADNSKHFYLYLNANKDKLGIEKVIWITRKEEIISELKEAGFDVYYMWSLASVWYHLRSKLHLVDQAPIDINAFFSVRSIRINLWHGFPLKKAGALMRNNTLGNRSKFRKWISKITIRGFWADHYVLATSDFAAKIQGAIFAVEPDKVIISGYPRNYESFIEKPIKFILKNEANYLSKIEYYRNTGYKIIGYFPTFRDKRETLVFGTSSYEELKDFFDICEKSMIKIVGKFHFAGKDDKAGEIRNHKGFINLPSSSDVYTFISQIDVLITDYSSVFYDFLLWHRPVIFFPYDLDYYRDSDRGLIFDYDEYTPGPKAKNIKELSSILLDNSFEKKYLQEYSLKADEIIYKVFDYPQNMDIEHLFNQLLKLSR